MELNTIEQLLKEILNELKSLKLRNEIHMSDFKRLVKKIEVNTDYGK